MKILIQARMGSKRFPKKTMYKFNNKPCLEHLVNSILNEFSRDEMVILTSKKNENNKIREFCRLNHIKCFSGSENNVAKRYYEFLKKDNCKYFVRICGDSPLFCAKELKSFLKNNKYLNHDIYSTLIERSYPRGNNFEVLKKEVFIKFYPLFRESEDFEHVTKFFYKNENVFRTKKINFSFNKPNINFCFDNKKDCKLLESIFSKLDKPHFKYSLKEKCDIYENLN